MTTDLEKQFYTTFGIEPKNRFKGCKLGAKYYSEICDEPTCNGCDDEIRETEYPQITDRILLGIEDIIHSEYNILSYEKLMDSIRIIAIPVNDPELGCDNAYCTVTAVGKNKKEALLKLATDYNIAKVIKHQVQALFKEER